MESFMQNYPHMNLELLDFIVGCRHQPKEDGTARTFQLMCPKGFRVVNIHSRPKRSEDFKWFVVYTLEDDAEASPKEDLALLKRLLPANTYVIHAGRCSNLKRSYRLVYGVRCSCPKVPRLKKRDSAKLWVAN